MKDSTGTEASLSTQMVHELTALPIGGNVIEEAEGAVQVLAEDVVRKIIFKVCDARKLIVPTVQARLEDLFVAWEGGQRSEDTMLAMCYCFILLAVAHVLAPSKSTDHICRDVFVALQTLSSIRDFNWSGFVLRHILKGTSSVKEATSGANEHVRLVGCLIVLQVIIMKDCPRLIFHFHSGIWLFCP